VVFGGIAHKQANKLGPSPADRWLNAMSGRAVEIASEVRKVVGLWCFFLSQGLFSSSELLDLAKLGFIAGFDTNNHNRWATMVLRRRSF